MEAGNILVKISADISEFSHKMKEATHKLEEFGRSSNSIMGGIGKAVAGTVIAVGALVGAVGKLGIEQNAMKEQATIAWETLLGSAEKAKKMVEDLQKMAAKTPFEFKDLDRTAKLLHMAGFEGKKLFEALTAVGDAVSAVGGGADELERVGMALFQMASKGKISAEEMNQLAENGIPVWKILSEQMHKPVKELMQMSQQGKLFADDVIPLLVDGMENKFGGAMQRQSQTFNGLMSTLSDDVKMFAADLTEKAFPQVKQTLQDTINLVERLRQAFAQGGWEGLAKEIIPPAVIQNVNDAKQALQDFRTELQKIWSQLTSGDNSIIKTFERNFNTLKSIIEPLATDISDFFDSIGMKLSYFWEKYGSQFIDALKTFGWAISQIFEALAPGILGILQGIWDGIKDIISGALNVILGLIKVFTGLFTLDFTTMWDGIKQIFSGGGEILKSIWDVTFGTLWHIVENYAGAIWNKIVTWWNNIKSKWDEGGNSIISKITYLWNAILNWFGIGQSGVTSKTQSIQDILSIIWTNIKKWVSDKVTQMWTDIKTKFGNIVTEARNKFNQVYNWITSPIKKAKDFVLGIIGDITHAFSSMHISIPKPRIPSISVTWVDTGILGVKYPTFHLSWHAKGGIFTGASIIGVGEKGAEAVVPLSQKHRMAPFAKAVAEYMGDTGKGNGTVINNYFTINATIREEADIEKLSKQITEMQKRLNRAGGLSYGV